MVDVVVVDAHGGVGLPMAGVAQLVRPPECLIDSASAVAKVQSDKVTQDQHHVPLEVFAESYVLTPITVPTSISILL